MTKLKAAISAGFAFTVILSCFFDNNNADIQTQSFFLPITAVGEKNKREECGEKAEKNYVICIDDSEEEIEFCFKISEIFKSIFK